MSNPLIQARAGQSFDIQASAVDVNGQQVPLDELDEGLRWQSDNVAVCVLTPHALGTATVQCVQTGQATISSRFGNRVTYLDVLVGAALESLTLTPTTPQ
jgi:hypothetical protein